MERFHRSLKASLRRQETEAGWTYALTLVPLVLRTALKTDIGLSPVEMLYKTTLRLPGEFFTDGPEHPAPDPTSYAQKFKQVTRHIRPTRPRRQQRSPMYVSSDLFTCTQVFLRLDAAQKPLQQPYDGSYRVIARYCDNKAFTVDVKSQHQTVSIDRLKQACQEYISSEHIYDFEKKNICLRPARSAAIFKRNADTTTK